MKLGILTLIILAFCAAAGFALIFDFSGSYQKVPAPGEPWCGRSIKIEKIRLNFYRITWELINGEKSVVELVGKPDGDMIDFRKRKDTELFGYTYTLADNKSKLTVVLTAPTKTIVCNFNRVNGKK